MDDGKRGLEENIANVERLPLPIPITNAREMEMYLDKAGVLIEALPYIQRFQGATIIVKYGGSAMIDHELKRNVIRFEQDVLELTLPDVTISSVWFTVHVFLLQ